MDQVVRAVVAAVDGPPGAPLGDREQEALWEEAVRSSAVPPDLAAQLTPGFLAAEYRTVVLGMPERTRPEYLRVKRAGRGVRLNRVQRAVVWNVVEAFERGRRRRGGRATTCCRLARRRSSPIRSSARRSPRTTT